MSRVAVSDAQLFIAGCGDRRVRESETPVEGRPDLVSEPWANVPSPWTDLG